MLDSKKATAVRFVDLMMGILQAHGDCLTRLAAFLGEDRLVELLENPRETTTDSGDDSISDLKKWSASWSDSPLDSPGNCYLELEDSVRTLGLPAMLEFHLWAYPGYRAWIESSIQLDAVLLKEAALDYPKIIDESVRQSKAWLKLLVVPSELAARIEHIAELPWIRFRSEMLKKAGKNPFYEVARINPE
jgi:hypothetical protein